MRGPKTYLTPAPPPSTWYDLDRSISVDKIELVVPNWIDLNRLFLQLQGHSSKKNFQAWVRNIDFWCLSFVIFRYNSNVLGGKLYEMKAYNWYCLCAKKEGYNLVQNNLYIWPWCLLGCLQLLFPENSHFQTGYF